ncbi:MAG: hypothetical protein LIP01_10890 [Tannerellaceae bacterium]|nr:hypothetical protein [Tannerellaceae bacterium]
METQTSLQQRQEAQFSDFCQLDIQKQEEICNPTYVEFLGLLRKLFIELDMGVIFRNLPRE